MSAATNWYEILNAQAKLMSIDADVYGDPALIRAAQKVREAADEIAPGERS